uniref:Uncharacterized protein n=1 Tax=Lepeophtheirus salmonis TaxID=72036 RepID=A0A0K2TGD8_LEPSM
MIVISSLYAQEYINYSRSFTRSSLYIYKYKNIGVI